MKNDTVNINPTTQGSHNDGSKGLVAALIVALALVFVIGAVVFTRSHNRNTEQATALENQKLELATQLSQRDSIINDWVLAFNDIESDIKKITARENMLNIQSMNPEISKDKKEEILKEIQVIRELIDQNKKRISSLNSQLKNSGIQIASLQTRIDTLNANIVQRDKDMAALRMELVDRNFEISGLYQKVDTMKTNLADRDNKITQQVQELNKAFVVKGTYKDLKSKGLLNREGKLLGLGGKETLQENSVRDDLFKQVNIAETKKIPVNSKSAKLVTEHPTSSYQMVKNDSDMIAYIEIKDPATFWKISKYAVVEVK